MSISQNGRYSVTDIYDALSIDGGSLREAVARVSTAPNSGPSVAAAANSFVVTSTPQAARYRWRVGDRLDTLAHNLLGDSTLYWQILDLNPTIVDPTSIQPGTVLAVPVNA